ncbi:hypothetical protein PIB30_049374 [Stylosanthes scabra]|uniref:Uncharacterized protein n=1 Tax=Stylosanthes scabra TaxID=79078 RepID=A0ABU6UHN8_9FABA|nr:hypothetical protein [Stylosanthes scabra]
MIRYVVQGLPRPTPPAGNKLEWCKGYVVLGVGSILDFWEDLLARNNISFGNRGFKLEELWREIHYKRMGWHEKEMEVN